MDYITDAATSAGAKVLLVGDWAQLSPVQAGGAFKFLADGRTDVAQLLDVHRFTQAWEREASLRLRVGDPASVEAYLGHDRVTGGARADLLDQLFTAWQGDIDAGRRSLMLAADRDTVNDLNTRARRHLVATGRVSTRGIRLGDGTVIGTGDLVVTRHNQRDLTDGRRWVKNGDEWTVRAVHGDGSLDVRRARGRRTLRLRADYVARHVELGYATTAHRAQGRTVDAAHAYVSTRTAREPLYVMATRGRDCNNLYVDTTVDPNPATSHDEETHVDARDVLLNALSNEQADKSATTTRDQEQVAADSPRRLAAQGSLVLSRRERPLPPHLGDHRVHVGPGR